jgi:hypothetical protein
MTLSPGQKVDPVDTRIGTTQETKRSVVLLDREINLMNKRLAVFRSKRWEGSARMPSPYLGSPSVLADDMKALLNEPSLDEPRFWEDIHQHAPHPSSVRLISVESDFRIFARAVRTLRRWGRETYPGVYFSDGSLASNPVGLSV